MKSPFTGKEMKVFSEHREITYRKEQFKILFHAYRCEDTGEQFEDEKFSELNFNQVVNQYRAKYNIPFPELIKSIRENYGLSAAKMSAVLGMGPNTWSNYESGEVPSKAHANLIQIIVSPETFKQLIIKNGELEDKDRLKILKKIESLDQQECRCESKLKRFETEPNIYNGYKSFNSEKVRQIVFFFADSLKPFKTKMNKLLFYADFISFRNTAQSITGLQYVAIKHGPVPNDYDILFTILSDEKIINLDWRMTDYGEVAQLLASPNRTFDSTVFTTTELETLEFVAKMFKTTSTREIVDISHKEPAWIENKDENKPISFEFAFRLEMV